MAKNFLPFVRLDTLVLTPWLKKSLRFKKTLILPAYALIVTHNLSISSGA